MLVWLESGAGPVVGLVGCDEVHLPSHSEISARLSLYRISSTLGLARVGEVRVCNTYRGYFRMCYIHTVELLVQWVLKIHTVYI